MAFKAQIRQVLPAAVIFGRGTCVGFVCETPLSTDRLLDGTAVLVKDTSRQDAKHIECRQELTFFYYMLDNKISGCSTLDIHNTLVACECNNIHNNIHRKTLGAE